MGTPRLAPLFTRLQRLAGRFYESRFWRLASHLYHKVAQVFTVHPLETQETYLQHLWFTMKMSVRFAALSIVLLTHGFFPFMFTRTASAQIEKVYVIMRSRIPKARRDAIDEYEI